MYAVAVILHLTIMCIRIRVPGIVILPDIMYTPARLREADAIQLRCLMNTAETVPKRADVTLRDTIHTIHHATGVEHVNGEETCVTSV